MSPLPELPFDIFVQILSHLPPTDDGTLALINCLSASRLLGSAAATPTLWEARYHLKYRHYLEKLETERSNLYAGNYKSMYVARIKVDQQALVLLSQIIHAESMEARIQTINKLVELSWDVWDVLIRESSRPTPLNFNKEQTSSLTCKPHPLTWHFWSNRVRQVIGSRYALETWHRLYTTTVPDTTLCEESLNAISCFYSFSPFDLAREMDKVADECRVHLKSVRCTLDPEHANFDLKEIATHVCAFMRLSGYAPVSERDFRRVENSLPHRYMHDCKDTIPLGLVHIFLGIVRRLGLQGCYVNFPNRLLACIKQSNPSVDRMIFVDVYQPGFLAESNMIEASQVFQSDWPTFRSHIMEGSNYNILVRSMGNLLACRSPDHKPYYVAHVPQVLRTPFNRNTALYLLNHVDDARLEGATFLLPTLKKLLSPEDYMHVSQLFALTPQLHTVAGEPQSSLLPKTRTNEDGVTVLHRVGTFFRHKKYDYHGLIRGWDYKCEMDDGWISAMRVDTTLSRGRNQPFYNTVDTEGTERYVAEENIASCSVSEDVAKCFFGPNSTTGRYFSDVKTQDEQILYLFPSPELLMRYPEDVRDE